LLLTELDQEAIGIRKTLQNVPEGKNDSVYLRLNQQKVPAIYGPSADEGQS
jgi:hypothetical protein